MQKQLKNEMEVWEANFERQHREMESIWQDVEDDLELTFQHELDDIKKARAPEDLEYKEAWWEMFRAHSIQPSANGPTTPLFLNSPCTPSQISQPLQETGLHTPLSGVSKIHKISVSFPGSPDAKQGLKRCVRDGSLSPSERVSNERPQQRTRTVHKTRLNSNFTVLALISFKAHAARTWDHFDV
ncbi:hypothetical protein B2J93_2018 [Marssonina coronariae]|uniref:Uncharacterized protein n=1 Tax=Diplocarpon coronariae TaxID=2795749 RepID=A0A218ZIU5_9HELO|nr:hypothetical protein B2J93_2018 [Marssonina coronariae]